MTMPATVPLQRWAQIENGVVHAVMLSAGKPTAPPSVELVNITDSPIEEGWRKQDGILIAPPASRFTVENVTEPSRRKEVRTDVPQPTMPTFLTKDNPLAPHVHDTMHYGVVVSGTVRVVIGKEERTIDAPYIIELPADIEHAAYSVTESAVFLSVFPERFIEVNAVKAKRP